MGKRKTGAGDWERQIADAIGAYEHRAATAARPAVRVLWNYAAEPLKRIAEIWKAGNDTPDTRAEVELQARIARERATVALRNEKVEIDFADDCVVRNYEIVKPATGNCQAREKRGYLPTKWRRVAAVAIVEHLRDAGGFVRDACVYCLTHKKELGLSSADFDFFQEEKNRQRWKEYNGHSMKDLCKMPQAEWESVKQSLK